MVRKLIFRAKLARNGDGRGVTWFKLRNISRPRLLYRFFSETLLTGSLAVLGGCSIGPKFPPGSEFVARMERTVDSKVPSKARIDASVDSPEAFKGAILQGSLLNIANGRLLGFSSLIEPGKQTCVFGDLVSITNSAGTEDRDDAGAKLTAQHIPAGQDITTYFQQCIPTGDPMSGQEMCSTYPITIPGTPARSFLIWSKPSRVFLKIDSVIRVKLYESPCATAPVAGKTSK